MRARGLGDVGGLMLGYRVEPRRCRRCYNSAAGGLIRSKQMKADVCRLAVVVQTKCICSWPYEPSWKAEVKSRSVRWGRGFPGICTSMLQ